MVGNIEVSWSLKNSRQRACVRKKLGIPLLMHSKDDGWQSRTAAEEQPERKLDTKLEKERWQK